MNHLADPDLARLHGLLCLLGAEAYSAAAEVRAFGYRRGLCEKFDSLLMETGAALDTARRASLARAAKAADALATKGKVQKVKAGLRAG